MTYKPSKLGQTGLLFCLRSDWEFIRRSLHACMITGLYVSQLRFVPPWLTHRHTDTAFERVYYKLG